MLTLSFAVLPVAAQEVIDSTGLPGPIIDDETTHTYSVRAGGIGTFADHTIVRRFSAPIQDLRLTIVDGRADDIGYVGSLLVTNTVPSCAGVSSVVAPVDVTSQVTVNGDEATLTLRAQENCCCVTGWGSATQSDRADARLHWEVTLGEAEYRVNLTTFIPAPWLEGPPSAFCLPGRSRPRRLFFAGDGRGFSATADSFRSRQLATLVTDENVDADGIVDGSVQNTVGETIAYASDALDDGIIDAEDDDGVLNDCTLLHDRDTGSNADMSVQSVRPVGGGSVLVRLRGGPGNPLARPSCDIDWDLFLQISDDGTTKSYLLIGTHDGFPAYELYINDQPIYQYDPAAAGRGLFSLCGGLDVAVQQTGTLP
jgi:hypothetical protein